MRSILPLTLLALSVSAKDISYQCSDKNPKILNAIGKFCQKKDLVVPSNYASTPMFDNSRQLAVRITGSCSPPQWVPDDYCMTQFYEVCAKGDQTGSGIRSYGRNGCQKWIIEADNSGPDHMAPHLAKGGIS